MTTSEFQAVTDRLCNLYAKELNEIQREFWYNNLKNIDVTTYRRAIVEYAKKNKYMPAISDILDSIKNLKPYEQPKKEMVECKACNGTGIVLYKKIVNGIEYEYASQCNCQNAVGLDYDGQKCKDKTDYYLAKAVDIFGVTK